MTISHRVRVVVVDSSVVMANLMAKHLSATSDIDVVGIARDPAAALELARRYDPDVFAVDVFMRGESEVASVVAPLARHLARVVIVSSTGEVEARAAVRGFGLGAVEYVGKPAQGVPGEHRRMGRDLVQAVRRAARSGRRGAPPESALQMPGDGEVPAAAAENRGGGRPAPGGPTAPAGRLVVIGTSTGGPAALRAIVPRLTPPLDAALIIIQHMPHTFTRSLAKRLDGESALDVREAVEGDLLLPGVALVAPGDYHLVVTSSAQVHLHRQPPVHGVRPSLDVTLDSTARQFGEKLLAVILTGMGVDGARGAAYVKARGGSVFAEHASTAIVYGMPRAVVEQGSADGVVPLHEMPEVISSWIQAATRTARRPSPTTRTPVTG